MMYTTMWWSLAALQLTILSQTAEAWPARHSRPPVCIIGAGPSGLTAASKLEAKGIKAVVFDKQAELGGKCQSYYDELGIFHPLGAAFFSNATYPETVKVINATSVSVAPFALAPRPSPNSGNVSTEPVGVPGNSSLEVDPGQSDRQQFRFNYTTGQIEDIPSLSVQFRGLLAAEIPRYARLWQTAFAPLSVPGFKNGVPKELTVSGTEWFHTNNFTALPIILVNPLALYGYGDINLVPILYILQYITPDILTAFIGQHDVYYADFFKIFQEWSKKALCKTEIKLSHEIRCIDRSGKNPVIKYTAPEGNFYRWGKQECSSLIMAFPPTIENLERAGLDLTEEENEVFKDVGVHNYFSSAVELRLQYGESYIAQAENVTVPPPNDGEPVAVLRLDERSNISTSWSWGPYREFESEASARNLLVETLSKINKDPKNATEEPTPLDSDDVRAFRKWDYFPHFDTEPLRNDAYGKLNRLQGCSKTFWASGLQGMETVEWAIRAGQDVVDSYLLNGGYLG